MCESTHIVRVDRQVRRRYKCEACGVLLYGGRGPKTDKLKTYACRYIGKDPMTSKRRLICPKPATATHSTDANTYCSEHGGGPPSHQVSRRRVATKQRDRAAEQREREANMERYASRTAAEVKAEVEAAPLPEPVKDSGGIGGVHIW